MVAETTWAYLAGIIDGEGCIRVGNSWKERSPRAIWLVITSGNTDLVSWLVGELGGKAYLKKQHNPCWDVAWFCRNVEPILQGTLPYLRIKKEQAILALAFEKLIGRKGEKITAENLSERKAVAEALSILKRQK